MITTQEAIVKRLTAAIDLDSKAVPDDPDSNPYNNHTVEELAQGKGVLKGADLIPAKNMAPEGVLGFDMEIERNAGMARGREDKSTKRSTTARARNRRAADYIKLASNKATPDQERMTMAWYVVFPLVQIITDAANSKRKWAQRLLGANQDDIAQITMEQMALILARSDRDLMLLREAAEELGKVRESTGKMPGHQPTDDERKHQREVKKARKWLMGMVNNRVMDALRETYTDDANLRWENIDTLDTILANVNGVGDDPYTARFKADRAPAFIGSKYQRPGGINAEVLAAAINAAITERGLDALVETLLTDENRRTDGAIRWTERAEQIVLAMPDGEWKWHTVAQATAALARPGRARGDVARRHTRELFEFLPGAIVAAIESFDPRAIAYTTSRPGGNAVLASDFELFYLPEPQRRTVLEPRLVYATAEQAAAALVNYLSDLATHEDLIEAAVNA